MPVVSSFARTSLVLSSLAISLTLATLTLATLATWQPAMAQRPKPTKELKDEELQGIAILKRAETLDARDKQARAKALVQRYLKDHPDDSLALRILGDCYFYADMEGSQHFKARHCYDRAVKSDPQNSIAYRMIAELNLVDGKYEQAALFASQALACKSPTPYALRTRAIAYHNLHRYGEAIKDMDTFLASNGGIGDTRMKWLMIKAGMLEDAKRFDEAIAVIKEVQGMQWTDDIALKEAKCYAKAGKNKEAIDVLSTIIAKNPEDEFAFSERAKVRVSAKQYKEALKDFNKSLELAPLAQTFRDRAALYEILGMKVEAKRDRDKAEEP